LLSKEKKNLTNGIELLTSSFFREKKFEVRNIKYGILKGRKKTKIIKFNNKVNIIVMKKINGINKI